uniref:Uncharacterized protein n=1 Tax=Salix viminalis TaxID=40686 RepID=A0A6N2N8Q4_SALVM
MEKLEFMFELHASTFCSQENYYKNSSGGKKGILVVFPQLLFSLLDNQSFILIAIAFSYRHLIFLS